MNTKKTASLRQSKSFLITIDVEDWFHVENFKSLIPFETWSYQESRIEHNIRRLLDLFDSVSLNPSVNELHTSPHGQLDKIREPTLSRAADNKTKSTFKLDKPSTSFERQTKKVRATFFVLCWIAERFPHIVREIAARGHEIASHGCYHELLRKIPLHSLHAELSDSRKRLEDTIGLPIAGFRAPSFSINDETLKAVAESGYRYDASYNSFSLNSRYGKISLNGQKKFGIAYRIFDNFYELPISNLNLSGTILPLGGGAYFRLIPPRLFRLGVKRVLAMNNAYQFYIHPWEIDPEQPRMTEASWNHKIRHYTMLSKTYDRLDRLITAFNYCHFTTCRQYLDKQGRP